MAEGKSYFKQLANISDIFICTGMIFVAYHYVYYPEFGQFDFEWRENVEFWMVESFMSLAMHLNLILQLMVAFDSMRSFVIIFREVLWQTLPFYVILGSLTLSMVLMAGVEDDETFI